MREVRRPDHTPSAVEACSLAWYLLVFRDAAPVNMYLRSSTDEQQQSLVLVLEFAVDDG